MDETHEKAKRALQPMFEEHVKFAAPLGMLRYNDQQMAATGPGGVARHIAAGSNFEEVLEKQAILGSNTSSSVFRWAPASASLKSSWHVSPTR